MTLILSGLAYGAERNVVLALTRPGFEKPWGILVPWGVFNVPNKATLIEALAAEYFLQMPEEVSRIEVIAEEFLLRPEKQEQAAHKVVCDTIGCSFTVFRQASDFTALADGFRILDVQHPSYITYQPN